MFCKFEKCGKIFLVKTKDRTKRRINYRPLLWIFLFAVFAIFATANIFVGNAWIFALFCVLFACALTLFILSFFKPNLLNSFAIFFNIKNLKIFFASLLITGALFSGLTVVNFLKYSKRTFADSMHSVNAIVREVVVSDQKQSVLLGDVIVDGERQSFNIKASCDVEIVTLKVGDKVDLNMFLFENKLVKNQNINTSSIKNNVFYYGSISNGVNVTDGKAHFVDYIKNNVKTLFLQSLDEDTAGLCFAVTMGDKSLLSDEYYQIFRQSGLAHVLAVSGLHVGFLVAIIIFFAKLLKIRAKHRFWIVAIILLFYNIICGFSPSVFRASIMSLCLLFGLIVGERNDSLSNLSLAGLIILLVQPLNLFDVGFLLSFSSVFGILFFQKSISRFFQKIKIPKFVADPLALTISATIGTLPWVCKYFGYLATLSVFSNLLVLPIFTLFYYILLPSTILGLIFGPNVLVVVNFFANIVTSSSAFFAKFGTIDLIKFDTICAVIYYVAIFFASPYFMLSAKKKLIYIFAMIVAFCPVIVLTNSSTFFDFDSISLCEKANDTAFLTTADNQKILLNVGKNKYGFSSLKLLLSQHNVRELDFLILTNYNSDFAEYLTYVVQKYNTKNIIVVDNLSVDDKFAVDEICQNQNLTYQSNQNFDLTDDIHISTYFENQKQKAINFRFQQNNFLFLLGAVSVENMSINYIFDQSFDVVVTNSVTDLRYESLQSQNFVTFNTTICDNTFTLIDDLWTIKF